MFAVSLALVSQEFHGRERGTAFGVWGATVGMAVAIGPLVGGALTTYAGWRWIFFLNVPIGAACIAAGGRELRESRDEHHGGFDLPGLASWTAALFALVLALLRGNAWGWASGRVIGLLTASAILLAAFALVELRRPEPMLDLRLLRVPTFAGAPITAFVLSAGLFSQFLYLALYLQDVLGYSAVASGVRFLPLSLASFVTAPLAGRLSARMPVRLLLGGGLALVGVALLLMWGITVGSTWTTLLAGFVVGGVGVGFVNAPLASTAVGVVEPHRAGMASGVNNTFRQVGIATGIAALGAIFQSRIASQLAASGRVPAGRVPELAQAVSAGALRQALRAVPAAFRPQAATLVRSAFISGLNEILLVTSVAVFAGALLALALVRRRDLMVSRATVAPAGADSS
jgi:EmrB/QacA subfamily drug resistance transporter